MNYASTANRANPMAALGALGVPAAVGAVLIVGLAVTAAIPEKDKPLTGIFVKVDPIEEPPEPTPKTQTTRETTTTQVPEYRPTPRPDSPIDLGVIDTGTLTTLPDLTKGIGDLGPIDMGIPEVRPTPSFAPVAASPRGNPGGWISTDDYRTSWINRGFEGVAGFTLSLDVSGRVTDCAITRSTGHTVLDTATCDLLKKRARFEPARGTSGEPVAGRFSSTVRWTIPE